MGGLVDLEFNSEPTIPVNLVVQVKDHALYLRILENDDTGYSVLVSDHSGPYI